jgi:hypothetical protein
LDGVESSLPVQNPQVRAFMNQSSNLGSCGSLRQLLHRPASNCFVSIRVLIRTVNFIFCFIK